MMSRALLTIALCVAASGCQDTTTSPAAQHNAMPESESTTTLKVGSTAPAFSLAGTDGAAVGLADAVARGPVVIVFYRGDW